MDLALWRLFLTEKAKDLQRVAGATAGVMRVEDLENAAYIVALEIGVKRGESLDLTDPLDQDAIIAKLYVEHVIRQDRRLKYALRIDRADEDEDGNFFGTIQLRAADSSDPLHALVTRAEEQEEVPLSEEERIISSFSQAAAYVVTQWRFHNDRGTLCRYLAICWSTFKQRFHRAKESMEAQPSLFDSIEFIDESFMPAPGKSYIFSEDRHLPARQLSWDFSAA